MRYFIIFGIFITSFVQAQTTITVGSDAHLQLSEGAVITVNDSYIVNEGAIIANKGLLSINNQFNVSWSGHGNYFLNDLSIDVRDRLDIASDVYVEGKLTLVNGVVDLSNQTLELGLEEGSIIGENEETYLYASGNGKIIKSFNFNGPQNDNPGNIGLEITSDESLGYGEITRLHQSVTLNQGVSIQRVYKLQTDVSRTNPIDVTLFYRFDEGGQNIYQPTLWGLTELRNQALSTTQSGSDPFTGSFVSGVAKDPYDYFTVGEVPLYVISNDTPTAFTPNGDGVNDTFYIPFLETIETAQVMIFNRWGEKIYESENYINQPWDGTWKGKTLNTNTFYYKVLITGEETIEGQISIVR